MKRHRRRIVRHLNPEPPEQAQQLLPGSLVYVRNHRGPLGQVSRVIQGGLIVVQWSY